MFLRLLSVPVLLVLPRIALAQEASLAGRIEGNVYRSATGLFSIIVPVLPELGGRIVDTPNVVTFDDDHSVHLGVACFPLDVTQKWELETRGKRDYLAYFFTRFVQPEFEQRYPGTTVEAARFLPDLQDGALAVFALLPGGSYFDGRNELDPDHPARPPAVAKRGNLLFVRRGHVFVINTELSERVTQPATFAKTPEEENRLLEQRLADILARMTFPAPDRRG